MKERASAFEKKETKKETKKQRNKETKKYNLYKGRKLRNEDRRIVRHLE